MNRFLVNLCLVALLMSSNSEGASPFDGELLFDSSELSQYKMPTSCTTENFCFDEGDYPKSKIDKIVRKLPFEFFDEIIVPSLTLDGSDNDDSECQQDDTFSDKPIYYIRDEQDQVRVVIQSENFTQLYSVKRCKRPGLITYGTKHFLAKSPILKHYKLECVNTYMNLDFLVLATGRNVEIARVKGGLPVYCKCRYPLPN